MVLAEPGGSQIVTDMSYIILYIKNLYTILSENPQLPGP